MNTVRRAGVIAFSLLAFSGLAAAPLLAQRAVEISEPGALSRLFSPTFYGGAFSGTYYNPHPIRINNTLFMFVQGGQFANPEPPGVSFCNGDGIILFETPYTSSGVLSPFSSVSRISLCTSPAGSQPPYHHWAPGNVFPLGSTYYMIGGGDYGTGLGGQAALWTATFNSQTNQFTNQSWQPFMNDLASGVGITAMMVQPDPTRTWNDGYTHQSVRGFAREGQQIAVEVRVDFSSEWCGTSLTQNPCSQIQFKQSGNWVSLVDGNLNFAPDQFLTDFKVNELTSQTIASNGAASPPYELWGAYNQTSNMCGNCQTGPTGGGFQYYQVNSDWTLGNTYIIHSHLRCMPSGLASMRSLAAPLYFGSHLYFYSSDNDDNICQTLSNPFDGMYIVWSELGLS
jgi:hypothetical protein